MYMERIGNGKGCIWKRLEMGRDVYDLCLLLYIPGNVYCSSLGTFQVAFLQVRVMNKACYILMMVQAAY